jgi:hypothetical protein
LIKKAYEDDLSVSVGVFFLNSSFNLSKGSHEKEAVSISGSGGGIQPLMFAEEFQLLTLE